VAIEERLEVIGVIFALRVEALQDLRGDVLRYVS
jgi:hypothetical protein